MDSTTISEEVADGIEASGMLTPSGPPEKKPERITAGKSCIVNLVQPYNISGTLAGTVESNYRILVKGPCGSLPGTFDEEWITYGTFKGTVNGTAESCNISYTANVNASGEVNGQIVFGQRLKGKLHVYGNFSDGSLSYAGLLK
jgi:cytoskeletal protein CcmA (bactofilin family)